jgi:hypothetical protein
MVKVRVRVRVKVRVKVDLHDHICCVLKSFSCP